MPNLITIIKAEIQTSLDQKKYEKAREVTIATMIALDLLIPTPQTGELKPHPLYDSHLKKCKENFIKYAQTQMAKDKDRTILIGDSIGQQMIGWIDDVVNPLLNFALGGMRAGHMFQLFEELVPLFKLYNFVPKNIVVGTPDGNGLLQHYEINLIKQACNDLLNRIRKEFPISRMILFNVPVTIFDYLILHYAEYTNNLLTWMTKDINSVFIPLLNHFINHKNWIFPKNDMSCDGIHLTPKGCILFGNLVIKGKKVLPRSIINNY